MDPQQGASDTSPLIVTEDVSVAVIESVSSTVPGDVSKVEEVAENALFDKEEASESESLKGCKAKVPDETSPIWEGIVKIQVILPAFLGFICLTLVPLSVGGSLAVPAGLGLLGLCLLGYSISSIDIKKVSNSDKT